MVARGTGLRGRGAFARAGWGLPLGQANGEVIFMDEPTFGLDSITRARLLAVMTEAADALGLTYVMVTHDIPFIMKIARRMVVMRNQVFETVGAYNGLGIPTKVLEDCRQMPDDLSEYSYELLVMGMSG